MNYDRWGENKGNETPILQDITFSYELLDQLSGHFLTICIIL